MESQSKAQEVAALKPQPKNVEEFVEWFTTAVECGNRELEQWLIGQWHNFTDVGECDGDKEKKKAAARLLGEQYGGLENYRIAIVEKIKSLTLRGLALSKMMTHLESEMSVFGIRERVSLFPTPRDLDVYYRLDEVDEVFFEPDFQAHHAPPEVVSVRMPELEIDENAVERYIRRGAKIPGVQLRTAYMISERSKLVDLDYADSAKEEGQSL